MLLVAGVYFYARHRVQNALKQVPEKIGLEIKQSATGFTVSKSEQGRTLFKIEASKAVQFNRGGHAELHDVAITLYGRDSNRYDQIYGSDFDYDPQSGDITARGPVQIDLEANPKGILRPDQAFPKELKNPIHLKTSGLVFNQKTGNAYTKERVEFRLPQASGSAVGVNYSGSANVLTLESQVNIATGENGGPVITANRGTISKVPRQVVLDHAQMETPVRHCEADRATLFLRPDNTLARVLATGNVLIQSRGETPAESKADELELTMANRSSALRTAVMWGNVTAEIHGTKPIQAAAGRVVFDFAAKNVLTKVHAEDAVKMAQRQSPQAASSAPQDLELTAAAVDFLISNGSRLDRAETSGVAQIALRPPAQANGTETLVTAGKFTAQLDQNGQLSSIHGAPDARIVSKNPGQADRISTSQTLDAAFAQGGGIDSIIQQGKVAYEDGERRAWGDRARYNVADQVLLLTGSPRVIDGGMTTTAASMRLNRATGDAFAEGDVKSTYSDLKPQLNGALLASASPIHVTARSMVVHGTPAVATYTGDARLWQDANIVQALSIEFDQNHRSMLARGSPAHLVSSVLVQTDKSGNSTPVAITSLRLTYADSERRAHFDENVVAKGSDFVITAKQMDAFLAARDQTAASQSSAVEKLDKIVALGQVGIVQTNRHANGERLVYTAADNKLVLTGGSPSIFDAEHGKITGVSLTFFRRDDRVFVEGNSTSPAVTETRVAR